MIRRLLIVGVLLLPSAALAQRGSLIDHWSVEQGLPNNAVADILQTADGYLWIATWAGTVRFDGVQFSPLDADLPNDHARALLEDRDGSVWIGVAGTGLARWRNGQVDTYTPAEGLGGSDVRTLIQDADGRIWAGTEGGLSILEPGGIRTLRVAQGLPHDTVNRLSVSQTGGVWVATLNGLCKADARALRCTVDHGVSGRVDVVLEDHAGRVWIGTPRGLTVAGGEHACGADCVSGTPVTALLQSRDGDIWAGLGTDGIVRIDGEGTERFGVADGLPAGTVVALHEDAEGSVWVAVYNGGLARIKPKRVTTFSAAEGLPGQVIGSIVQDVRGEIWAGTQCGPVSVLRGGRFVPQFVDEMRGACAWILWAARDGSLWIGTRGHGVYHWANNQLRHVNAADGLTDLHIAALFEDRDGTIWIGTEFGGVHRYRDGQLSRGYGVTDGVATGYIASFAQDRDGRVWIGSNANGLSVFEGGTFRTLGPEESPPTRNIAGLLIDSRGDLWIASAANGLFRRRHGRYEPFGPEQGLGDRLVAVVVEDGDANLWVGTARGISRLDRARLEAVAEGRAAMLDPIILDRSDGMLNAEGSGGGLDPSGLRSRDGRLWFSTIDGIAVIDPATFETNRIVPKVLVEGALLEERPWPRRGDGTLEVPAGTSSLEIDYTAFSFMAPAKMRFRYRLTGFDRDWHDVGTRRAAFYSRLPPGDYTFEVMATNNDGVWSSTPATLQLVVMPFLWERTSVQMAAMMALLILTGVLFSTAARRRDRRRLADHERERALERERTRIARDLHDDLGSRLAHIALMADRGSDNKRLSSAVRTAVESLDELVWTVNAGHDTLDSFAAYTARCAEEHVAAAGLRLRLHIAADLPAVEVLAETRRHLYLGFKEAITNAIKHAQASEIHVSVTVAGDWLVVEVADDGRGLQGPSDPTGHGLSNIRERMRLVGGAAELGARPGGGARVVLKAPIVAVAARPA